MPPPRRDGIGVCRYPQNICPIPVMLQCILLGAIMLCSAITPQQDNKNKRPKGPIPSHERLTAGTNLAVCKAKKSGRDQGDYQRKKNQRLKDENKAACIPAIIEWRERAHSVVVRVVEQDVAQVCQQCEEPYPAPI